MGCFLGCFGFASSRKRQKITKRIFPRDQRFAGYQLLDSSSLSTRLDLTESDRYEEREQPVVKVKKKVSFNPNVRTYEPIQKTSQEFHSEDEDEENKKEERRDKKMDKGSQVLISEEQKAELKSYPSDYRYRDCIESYYDEDDIEDEDSELEEDEYYFGEEDDEDEGVYDGGVDVDEQRIDLEERCRQRLDSNSKDAKSVCLSNGSRDRGRYACAVLNPVENLAKWKAVKAKNAKEQMKENVPVPSCDQLQPLLPKIPVDASLSSWLVRTKTAIERSAV